MAETSSELNIIFKHLQQLLDKKDQISEIEKSFSPGKPLDKKQRKALSSKSSVTHQIDCLVNLVKEIFSSEAINNIPRLIIIRLRALRKKRKFLLRLQESLCQGESLGWDEAEAFHSRPSVLNQLIVLQKLSLDLSPLIHRNPLIPKSTGLLDILSYGPLQPEESLNNVVFNRSRMNTKETKPRYLCLFSGLKISCLDLEQCEYESMSNAGDVPPIPEIATLNLVKEGLPMSAGLYKSGSDVYMVGGHHISASVEELHHLCSKWWDMDPLCEKYGAKGVKGSSRFTHRLFLDDGALSLDRKSSNIFKGLKMPKIWPIVEKINGEIHVIDSVPPCLSRVCSRWVSSHEVLSTYGKWSQIRTTEKYGDRILSHLVFSDRIYAEAAGGFLVYNSKERIWEAVGSCDVQVNPFFVKHVWHILRDGFGRCVGVFPSGDLNRPLYVVVAFVRDPYDRYRAAQAVVLVYLVTSTGRVICMQHLHGFFKGPVCPCYTTTAGTLIQVDEDGETMCSVITGSAWDARSCDYVYVNTFTVEMIADSALEVQQHLEQAIEDDAAKGRDDGDDDLDKRLVEVEFVRLHLKDSYVFRAYPELEVEEVDFFQLDRLSACFL